MLFICIVINHNSVEPIIHTGGSCSGSFIVFGSMPLVHQQCDPTASMDSEMVARAQIDTGTLSTCMCGLISQLGVNWS